jgi:NAD-dependent histone deacetylase SIR2
MWINHDAVPVGKEFETCWDLIIKGDCDEVARHVGLKEWNDDSEDVFDECTASEVERVKQKHGGFSVVVHTPKKKHSHKNTGILTPSSSQDEALTDTKAELPNPINLLANPASKGRPLSELLSAKGDRPIKRPKKAGAKGPLKKSRTMKEQANKINQQFPVGKANKPTVATSKSEHNNEDDLSQPMHPISPGAARNNGPMFPGLLDTTARGSSPTSPWKDNIIISPTGRIPPDIDMMLNHE